MLSRPDVDAVLIGTPDHWHAKVAVEAVRAGKDVYCEKPMKLTVAEGRLICDVLKTSDRVFQVGTQQRSEFGNRFLTAVALVRSGRLGPVRRALVGLERGSRAARSPRPLRPTGSTGTAGSALPRRRRTSRSGPTGSSAGGTTTPAAS